LNLDEEDISFLIEVDRPKQVSKVMEVLSILGCKTVKSSLILFLTSKIV